MANGLCRKTLTQQRAIGGLVPVWGNLQCAGRGCLRPTPDCSADNSDREKPGAGSAVFCEADFADEGQIAVALRVVDSVADDKFIRDLKADPIRAEIDLTTGGFVE